MTHLDPRIGFLHEANFRSFSLNLDVAEVFKPIIVDRLIFHLINKGMIDDSHFVKELGGVLLNERGREVVVREFERRMATTIKRRPGGRSVSYRRLIRIELYKLERHLIGEAEYIPFVAGW
jgi:CRISPR-associated protein Cas1